ncbi:hypothetical protein [Ascidiimonas sp. W6]|uniref:hypothetical protein n=1 Tax=Ascidiimonas meishanensis TaxID=3128903 RepID=UPI0030EC7091
MEKTSHNSTTSFLIISDYLTKDEIKNSLENEKTKTNLISGEGDTRNDLNPVVIAAIVSAILRGPAIANQTIHMVRNLRKKNKLSKPEGYIIVETPNSKTRISFNLSDEDFKRKLEELSKLSEIPQIFITKRND